MITFHIDRPRYYSLLSLGLYYVDYLLKVIDKNDPEARLSLKKAILHSVSLLSLKCSIFTSKKPKNEYKITNSTQFEDIETWKLMEALCLLSILLKADEVWSKEVCNVFGKTGPIHISEDNEDRYLWAQAPINGEITAMKSIPDLVVTNDSDLPSVSNVLRIIECKSGKKVGAPMIRAEFGKAYDLKVSSYLIWSFITPSEVVTQGARGLGLDIEALGFDTDMRDELIKNPELLVYHVANALEVSRKESRMLQELASSMQQVNNKFPSLSSE